MKLLMLYSTYEYQTAKIMQYIMVRLGNKYDYDLVKLDKNTNINLNNYQAIIIGSSVRYGRYPQLITKFINDNYLQLNKMISAFFGVNLVARKEHKNTPFTNSYTKKFLAKIKWQPNLVAVFAGALYFLKYNFWQCLVIRLIMRLGGAKYDVKQDIIEYTNWAKVDEFAKNFSCLVIDN